MKIRTPARLRVRDIFASFLLSQLVVVVLALMLSAKFPGRPLWIDAFSRSIEVAVFIGLLFSVPAAKQVILQNQPGARGASSFGRTLRLAGWTIAGLAVVRVLLEWVMVLWAAAFMPDVLQEPVKAVSSASVVLRAVIVAPVAEEIIYRGGMLMLLASRFGQRGALLLTSIVFAISHHNPLLAFLLGLLFGLMYFFTGRIWVPMLGHAAANLTAFFMYELFSPVEIWDHAGAMSPVALCFSVLAVLLVAGLILSVLRLPKETPVAMGATSD